MTCLVEQHWVCKQDRPLDSILPAYHFLGFEHRFMPFLSVLDVMSRNFSGLVTTGPTGEAIVD